MSPNLHQTKDGSSTLYSTRFKQFYHNPNGAATESLHVFFDKPGVTEFIENQNEISILEVGFGTGLNFLLLLDLSKKLNPDLTIKYYSIEAFPVSEDIAQNFDFQELLQFPELNNELPEYFMNLNRGWNLKRSQYYSNAELHLYYGSFTDFETDDLKADFIFHDPFSPDVNAELWTNEVFLKLKSYSNPDVILSTYCAASKARAAMATAGWKVARTPGALGKREMTVAALNSQKLQSFKRVNEAKLAERYRSGGFD